MVNSDWYGNGVMCASVETVDDDDMATSKTLLLFFLLTNNSTTSKGKFNTILSGIVEFCNRWCCWFCSSLPFLFAGLFPSMTWHEKARKIKFNKYFFFIQVYFRWQTKNDYVEKFPTSHRCTKYFLKWLCAGDKQKRKQEVELWRVLEE